MKKLQITMVSESEFSVKGQGVHTAFFELTHALNRRSDVEVQVNKWRAAADITHIQTVGPYSLWFLLFGKGKKVVSAHVVPASFVGSLVGAKYWLWFARLYLKWFYGRADLVFAVSKKVRDELVDGMQVKSKVEVLYNSVDMSRYKVSEEERTQARKKLSIADGVFVVVGNGQVQPRKRVDVFIETAELSDALFIWNGGIPFKRLGAEYDEMNALLSIERENLRMTGIIPHEDVRTYMQAADAFYLPAAQENHPMCVLEASGASLPIILNDIPEYDDTFRPDAVFVTTAAQAADEISRLRTDSAYYKERQRQSDLIARRFDSANGAEMAMRMYAALLQ